MRIRKAVLPVAGLGTRVLPATKSIPKELLPIVDRPAVQIVVSEAIEAGIEHFVFVTGRNKGAIEDYFDIAYELNDSLEKKNKIAALEELRALHLPAGATSFVRQQGARGLGHAIWCARDVIGYEPFAVLLPDVIIQSEKSCMAQMVDAYKEVGGNIVAVDAVPLDEVSSYGVIAPKSRRGRLIEMDGMVEKPEVEEAPSNLKITGRYILQPEIFDVLEQQAPGAGGEVQLTDSMATLMQTQDFHAVEHDGVNFDCGSKIGYFQAVLSFALAHPEISESAAKLVKESAAQLAKSEQA